MKDPTVYIQGYVYFLSDGEAIKIGFSTAPHMRMRGLQVPHRAQLQSLGTIAATQFQERILHNRFRHLALAGEWFRDDGEIREFLAELDEDGRLTPMSEHIENAEMARLRKRYKNLMIDQ